MAGREGMESSGVEEDACAGRTQARRRLDSGVTGQVAGGGHVHRAGDVPDLFRERSLHCIGRRDRAATTGSVKPGVAP